MNYNYYKDSGWLIIGETSSHCLNCTTERHGKALFTFYSKLYKTVVVIHQVMAILGTVMGCI